MVVLKEKEEKKIENESERWAVILSRKERKERVVEVVVEGRRRVVGSCCRGKE